MEILTIFNSIAIIYLLFQISSLKKNSTQKSSTQIPLGSSDSPNNTQTPTVAVASNTLDSAISAPKSIKPGEDSLSRIINWLRTDWMLKLGGLFILLAVSWFLTYAFMNNWIGETGRIVLGVLFGSFLMAYGTKRMTKYIREGEVVLGVGAIILTTSIFAGQHSYDLYSDTISLITMTFVAFVIASVSYLRKRETLAVLGVLMIGLTPLLAGYENTVPNVPGLLTYLIVMTIGVIWLSRATSWRSVNILNILIVSAYFFPYCFQYSQLQRMTYPHITSPLAVDVDILRFFAIIFSITFNMSSFFALLSSKVPKRSDFQFILVSATFVVISIMTIGNSDLMPLKLSIIAMAYMGLAVVTSRILKNNYYIELYSTISILFLVWATVKAVNLELLPLFLAIEVIVLTIFYDRIFARPYTLSTSLMYFVIVFISLDNIVSVGRNLTSTINFFGVLASTYFPYFYKQLRSKPEADSLIEKLSLIGGNLIGAIGFLNGLDNLGRHLDMLPSTVKVIRYTTFSILGSFIYFVSRTSAHSTKYWFGIGFIIYVVASLLLIEVWSMDIVSRIIVFFSIGILFMSSIVFTKLYEKKSQ